MCFFLCIIFHMIFVFFLLLNIVKYFKYIYILYHGLFTNDVLHRKRGQGVEQKMIFDNKWGKGGLGKSDFCDKEGGGV